MNEASLRFFDSQPDALPLYEMLEARILNEIPDVTIKVQKTQISFFITAISLPAFPLQKYERQRIALTYIS